MFAININIFIFCNSNYPEINFNTTEKLHLKEYITFIKCTLITYTVNQFSPIVILIARNKYHLCILDTVHLTVRFYDVNTTYV